MVDNDQIISDEYTVHDDEPHDENQEDRVIRGEPEYFTTGQVAEQIGEPDSTIRFWCDEFDEFLKIEKTGSSGRRRQFTRIDIKRIEYIRYLLKEENLSIRQVKEFLSTPEAEKMLPIAKEKEQIMIEALANAVSSLVEDVFDRKLAQIEEMLLHSAEVQAKAQEKFKAEIINEVTKTVTKELRTGQEGIKNTVSQTVREENREYIKQVMETKHAVRKHLDEAERASLERDKKLIEEMRKRLEKKPEEQPKGFFSRLFGK